MHELERITLDGTVDMVERAISRIKAYEDMALALNSNGYYVAYSGGKDSDCIRILCELAGVKYELWHNHTTVDAPETVYYVRSIPKINISYPELSMWRLIEKKKMPPTRILRYCCSELKEKGGEGRFVITGVRWEESVQRSNRESLEVFTKNKSKRLILNADNDESRRMIETCVTKGARMLNPIIDWTEREVWAFLRYYSCKSNPLYECGFRRVGCVGCPMARRAREKEFVLYPKYKGNYIKAFERMIRTNSGATYTWQSGEKVFDWWMSEENQDKPLDGQLNLFDMDDV